MFLASPGHAPDLPTTTKINDAFLSLKPVIERHAAFVFRALSATDREEAIAEAVAAAFQSYLSLTRRGKNPHQFPTMMAVRAAQHVLNARQVGGRSHRNDLFHRAPGRRPRCQRHCLPKEQSPEWAEALVDNRRTPIPDQVSFRCDFPRWLQTLTHRNRKIALLLAIGGSTKSLACQLGLQPARISQLRTEFYQSWQRFHDEDS